jgi:hypothetical protein
MAPGPPPLPSRGSLAPTRHTSNRQVGLALVAPQGDEVCRQPQVHMTAVGAEPGWVQSKGASGQAVRVGTLPICYLYQPSFIGKS